MDILTSLGIDVGICFAIVGVTQYIKKHFLMNKGKGWKVITPLILSIIAGVVITIPTGTWNTIALSIFKYFGISVLFYEFILSKVKKLIEKNKS